jgi:chromosome segregation ATPase
VTRGSRVWDVPLSPEELDEIQKQCEALVEEDPDYALPVATIRLLQENAELRLLLSTVKDDKTEAWKKLVESLRERVEEKAGRIEELELERKDLGERIREQANKIFELEDRVASAAQQFLEGLAGKEPEGLDVESSSGEVGKVRLALDGGKVRAVQDEVVVAARAVPKSKRKDEDG